VLFCNDPIGLKKISTALNSNVSLDFCQYKTAIVNGSSGLIVEFPVSGFDTVARIVGLPATDPNGGLNVAEF
jgi:hypothetical protein